MSYITGTETEQSKSQQAPDAEQAGETAWHPRARPLRIDYYNTKGTNTYGSYYDAERQNY